MRRKDGARRGGELRDEEEAMHVLRLSAETNDYEVRTMKRGL
jgi:hypothetical protein